MSDVAILIPVLGRPHLIEPLINSVKETSDASVYFATTRSDFPARRELRALGQTYVDVPWKDRGDYARKINVLFDRTDEKYVFLGATDLIFHDGWEERALAPMSGFVGVVGTNDMGSKKVMEGRHSTHTMVSRSYVENFGLVDEPGKVLYEGYWHEFVDDELVETAKSRNSFCMALDSRVEHVHPMWGKADWDEGYLDGDRRYALGKRVFRKRRKLWTR